MARKASSKTADLTGNPGFEAKLWPAAEPKHVAPGLIFLNARSDPFEGHRAVDLPGWLDAFLPTRLASARGSGGMLAQPERFIQPHAAETPAPAA